MATTTNYSLPLIESSEYSSKLFSDFVAMLCGNSNSSALVMIDALLKGKASLIDGKVPSNELPSYVDDIFITFYRIFAICTLLTMSGLHLISRLADTASPDTN